MSNTGIAYATRSGRDDNRLKVCGSFAAAEERLHESDRINPLRNTVEHMGDSQVFVRTYPDSRTDWAAECLGVGAVYDLTTVS